MRYCVFGIWHRSAGHIIHLVSLTLIVSILGIFQTGINEKVRDNRPELETAVVKFTSLWEARFAFRRQVNLSLTGSVSPSTVSAGDSVTYSLTVTNHGSSLARNVIVDQTLDGPAMLLSASPLDSPQGCCHVGDGVPIRGKLNEQNAFRKVSCSVGDLKPGRSTAVTITVKTTDFGDGLNLTPIPVHSQAEVTSEVVDSDPTDDKIKLTFEAIPSSNRPPVARILNLPEGSVFVTSPEKPVAIILKIVCSDIDGTIAKVVVFDDGAILGNATAVDDRNFTFSFSTVRTGYHSIWVMAIDDKNRSSTLEVKQFLVNSPHKLSIVKPNYRLIRPGSSVNIDVISSLSGSEVESIEVFDTGFSLGKLKQVSRTGKTYLHRLSVPRISRGTHSLTAILTDLKGATTISDSVEFKASVSPTITLRTPRNGTDFQSNASIDIAVKVGVNEGFAKEVRFYANGKLIASMFTSIGSGEIAYRWISPPDGTYLLVAEVTDDSDETA